MNDATVDDMYILDDSGVTTCDAIMITPLHLNMLLVKNNCYRVGIYKNVFLFFTLTLLLFV
jgi:hypothetical protein